MCLQLLLLYRTHLTWRIVLFGYLCSLQPFDQLLLFTVLLQDCPQLLLILDHLFGENKKNKKRFLMGRDNYNNTRQKSHAADGRQKHFNIRTGTAAARWLTISTFSCRSILSWSLSSVRDVKVESSSSFSAELWTPAITSVSFSSRTRWSSRDRFRICLEDSQPSVRTQKKTPFFKMALLKFNPHQSPSAHRVAPDPSSSVSALGGHFGETGEELVSLQSKHKSTQCK